MNGFCEKKPLWGRKGGIRSAVGREKSIRIRGPKGHKGGEGRNLKRGKKKKTIKGVETR